MDKTSKIALYAISFVLLLMIIAEVTKPKALNWRDSYSASDKIPLGCYVLFNELESYSGFKVESSTESLFQYLKKLDSTQIYNLVLINNYITLDEQSSDAILKFVDKGNSVFFSANGIYGAFIDSLNIEFNRGYSKFYKEPTVQKFTNPQLKNNEALFEDVVENNFLTSIDTLNTLVLGTFEFADDLLVENIKENAELKNGNNFEDDEFEDDDKEPFYDEVYYDDFDYTKNKINFIKVPIGSNGGQLFLHTNPFAFTNYHMLNDKDNYVAAVLSYLPKQPIIWDNYYKSGRLVITSPLRFVLSNPELKWAFYLSLSSLFLFVLFRGKRTQRIIPVVEPLKNATVAFTQTIGDLYYQNGNFTNIISKKITFFLEFVRTRYYLETATLNEQFIDKLALKSSNSKEDTKATIDYITYLKSKSVHIEQELIELNKKIETFTKNKI
ncbi:DUF4350 domain-containing protein [Paucihalobacter sp.]|uniref:DUF4350 domain-containing protein n=1 Tax=Paucihalobacter sp. TaxID=2850405 RepID=UPI003D1620AC